MYPAKFLRPSILLAAGALALVLLSPCIARAVGIGEAVLFSKLGQPLHAQVELTMDGGEQIDESCLSLVAPDSGENDLSGYVTKAKLALKADGSHLYVDVSSYKPLNDAFARFRLRVRCMGMGSVIKTLAVLPDLDTPVEQAPITSPSVASSAENIPAPASYGVPDTKQRTTQKVRRETDVAAADMPVKPAGKRHRSMAQSAHKPGRADSFRLKLSGGTIDESRIGKISAEERALLLARQKLLDADDQMASFLAMQNQVKQLQNELGEIKLQLAQLGATPHGTLSAPAVSGAQVASPKSAVAVKQPEMKQNNIPYREYALYALYVVLGLLLTTLMLWQGLRFYRNVKARAEDAAQQDELQIMPPAPVSKPFSQIRNEQALAADTVAKASEASTETAPTDAAEDEASEIDAMLEEAGLYAAHGRPAKAVEILQEIIKRCPSKVEAWPLLLSIYSALGKAAEFEKTARQFLEHHQDSPAWSGIQALGRTFDKKNPLYLDQDSRISSDGLLPEYLTLHRPIGDVLIEMGAMSKQELQSCLDTFDPKKHGRFGGYLVARKAITLAQLDQALLQQQGVVTESKSGALPSLQEMESFLADFDPKRDGSVAEFLASRQAVTPDQIGQLLQKHSSHTAVAESPKTVEIQPANKVLAPEFVLGPIPEPSEPEEDKPLDPDFEPSPPPRSF